MSIGRERKCDDRVVVVTIWQRRPLDRKAFRRQILAPTEGLPLMIQGLAKYHTGFWLTWKNLVLNVAIGSDRIGRPARFTAVLLLAMEDA